MKKLLSGVIVLAMLLTLIVVPTFAEEEETATGAA